MLSKHFVFLIQFLISNVYIFSVILAVYKSKQVTQWLIISDNERKKQVKNIGWINPKPLAHSEDVSFVFWYICFSKYLINIKFPGEKNIFN